MTVDNPSDMNGQTTSKYGEYGIEKPNISTSIEKWYETHKGHEDYWERKSDKVTRFYEMSVSSLFDREEEQKKMETDDSILDKHIDMDVDESSRYILIRSG